MATESMIVDSGPLILLAKIDALSILVDLNINCIAPPVVQKELEAGPIYGHPPVVAPWLEIRALSTPIPPSIQATLDDGEAAVIQLALEQNITHVCLDDLRGRRMAKALGLEVVGLLGLLVRAKRRDIIQELKPYTSKLITVGARYSPSLIKEVLIGVGELP